MDVDLFYAWRAILVTVTSIYVLVRLCESTWRWQQYLWAGGRPQAMLRNYLAVMVLRMRFRRFAGLLISIALLAAALALIIWLHRIVP